MCFTFADMAVGVGRILTWFGEGSQHLGCFDQKTWWYNQEEHIEVVDPDDQQQDDDDDDDVRYEPIVEDFMYEDKVISPCYIILPYVTEEEIEAASYPPIVSHE